MHRLLIYSLRPYPPDWPPHIKPNLPVTGPYVSVTGQHVSVTDGRPPLSPGIGASGDQYLWCQHEHAIRGRPHNRARPGRYRVTMGQPCVWYAGCTDMCIFPGASRASLRLSLRPHIAKKDPVILSVPRQY